MLDNPSLSIHAALSSVLNAFPGLSNELACAARAYFAALSSVSEHGFLLASINSSANPGPKGPSVQGTHVPPQPAAPLLPTEAPPSPRRWSANEKTAATPLCAGCGVLLTGEDVASFLPAAGSAGAGPSGRGGALHECTGCHRCFHDCCHRRWAAARLRGQPQPPAAVKRQHRSRWLLWRGATPEADSPAATDLAADCSGSAGAPAGINVGSGAIEDEDGGWFHSRDCWQVHRALERLCRAGARPVGGYAAPPQTPLAAADAAAKEPDEGAGGSSVCTSPGAVAAVATVRDGGAAPAAAATSNAAVAAPGDLAVRLYDCRRSGPGTSAGLRRAHSVLRQEFGYSLADCRQFDYAALLTQDHTAVSAALLDVYGSDLAELCLVATCTALQRRGYGMTLVRHLERDLGGAGVRQLLVSVDDDDEPNQTFWRERLGFRPLEDAEVELLGRSFGAFTSTAAVGTVFLSRYLL